MRTTRSSWRLLALGVTVTLSVAACGSSSDPTRVRTDTIPTGATDIVVRVDTRGGLTSREYQLGIVPQLTVFGDGRVVVDGPVTEQYPPHALPNLLTGTLSRAAIVRLVERARRGDLLRTRDFGQPSVKDHPTTSVTFFDASCPPTASCAAPPPPLRAYGLDFTEGGALTGLTPAQRDARRQLRSFIRDATDAATRVATEPYTASAVAIYVRPANPVAADDPVEPGHASWPLGELATIGDPVDQGPGADSVYRCAVLTGADATKALAVAAQATGITRWESGGSEYVIVWRPLLPDEHACPGLGTKTG